MNASHVRRKSGDGRQSIPTLNLLSGDLSKKLTATGGVNLPNPQVLGTQVHYSPELQLNHQFKGSVYG